MTIRPALPSEAKTARALARDAYSRWIPRLGREPSPMHADYAAQIAAGTVWFLEANRQIMGLLVLKDGPEGLLIPNIAVASAMQGKGLGTRLLAFAEEEARRRGYGDLRLYENALMVENIGLYEHVGFTEIARVQRSAADRTYLCMAKTVA